MKIARSSCLLLLAVAGSPHAWGETFTSTRHGFSLEIPEGWQPIPEKVVNEVDRLIFNKGKSPTDRVVVLQREDAKRWYTYPYVLISVAPYAESGIHRQIYEHEFDQILRAMTGRDVNKDVESIMNSEVYDMVGDISLSQPRLDRKNRRFFWSTVTSVPGAKIQASTVGYFGRDAMVLVNYCDRAESWSRHADSREVLLDSVKFAPHKAYNEALARPPTAMSPFAEKVVSQAGIGIFIGMIGGLLAYTQRRNSKTPSAPIPGQPYPPAYPPNAQALPNPYAGANPYGHPGKHPGAPGNPHRSP